MSCRRRSTHRSWHQPGQFVYRNLANTSLDIVSGSSDAVANHADEMALMNASRRASGSAAISKVGVATVSIPGGRIENS